MAVLSRHGAGGQAGKTGGNPKEPIFALSISGQPRSRSRRPIRPTRAAPSPTGATTGRRTSGGTWRWSTTAAHDHVRRGPRLVDNPATIAVGLATLGLPWVLGGHDYAGAVDQVFHGWIGDVRVVDRALKPDPIPAPPDLRRPSPRLGWKLSITV